MQPAIAASTICAAAFVTIAALAAAQTKEDDAQFVPT
jgi:hypothetical protein